MCYIHKDKNSCHINLDDVNEYCIWYDKDESKKKKNKIIKSINKNAVFLKNKVKNTYKEVDTPVGKSLQRAFEIKHPHYYLYQVLDYRTSTFSK